jgi:hypothetical protein
MGTVLGPVIPIIDGHGAGAVRLRLDIRLPSDSKHSAITCAAVAIRNPCPPAVCVATGGRYVVVDDFALSDLGEKRQVAVHNESRKRSRLVAHLGHACRPPRSSHPWKETSINAFSWNSHPRYDGQGRSS